MDNNRQKAEEHKQNVSRSISKETTPEARARVLLQGTLAAMKAVRKQITQKADDEIAFMEENLEGMVQAIIHGVKE